MTSILKVFDVEHGSCALLRTDTGARMLIDCGRNFKTGWSPALQLLRDGATSLEMLVITNYDEDHVDGLPELREHLPIQQLWRTKNVNPAQIVQLKSEDGMGNGIAELVKMAMQYTGVSAEINFGNVTREMFYNPEGSFDDENNLSAIIVLSINGKKVLFTGDMERAGFDLLMNNNKFISAVSNADVLIAPHHGRECSVHEQFLNIVRPYWTVISDKGFQYSTQETVPTYRKYSRGGLFRGEQRQVLTTRSDGTITFCFENSTWFGI